MATLVHQGLQKQIFGFARSGALEVQQHGVACVQRNSSKCQMQCTINGYARPRLAASETLLHSVAQWAARWVLQCIFWSTPTPGKNPLLLGRWKRMLIRAVGAAPVRRRRRRAGGEKRKKFIQWRHRRRRKGANGGNMKKTAAPQAPSERGRRRGTQRGEHKVTHFHPVHNWIHR
eukprot:gene25194-biopygen13504